jgi:hypothetical protein
MGNLYLTENLSTKEGEYQPEETISKNNFTLEPLC